MIMFDILNRWSGEVQFTADIKCSENAARSVKLGLAVKWAHNSGAVLRGAELRGASLRGAVLSGASLRDASLIHADLSGANLSGADLFGANLSGANLSGAVLSRVNLTGANMSYANLNGAVLSGASLFGVNLTGAKATELPIARTRILPEGALIGWKMCRNNVIVKLRIPEAARRSHAFGRKCRAEFVEVLEVIGAEYGISEYDSVTKYRPGERVICHGWHEDWRIECAGGIHFYITRLEAENH